MPSDSLDRRTHRLAFGASFEGASPDGAAMIHQRSPLGTASAPPGQKSLWTEVAGYPRSVTSSDPWAACPRVGRPVHAPRRSARRNSSHEGRRFRRAADGRHVPTHPSTSRRHGPRSPDGVPWRRRADLPATCAHVAITAAVRRLGTGRRRGYQPNTVHPLPARRCPSLGLGLHPDGRDCLSPFACTVLHRLTIT